MYRRKKLRKALLITFITLILVSNLPGAKVFAAQYPLLRDYYALIYGWYYKAAFLSIPKEPSLPALNTPTALFTIEPQEYSQAYNEALIKMGKSLDEGSALVFLRTHPFAEKIRTDPRFNELLIKAGFNE